jgi:hypothetical protein
MRSALFIFVFSLIIGITLGVEIPISTQLTQVTHFLTISGIILGISGIWMSLSVGLGKEIQTNHTFLKDSRGLWVAVYWSLFSVAFSSIVIVGTPIFYHIFTKTFLSQLVSQNFLRGLFCMSSIFFLFGQIFSLILVLIPANTLSILKIRKEKVDTMKENKYKSEKKED